MPYGIHSPTDVCQNRISHVLESIEGAANSQDYIINWGETLEELTHRTIKVFKSIRNQGLKLNKKNYLFNKSEVIFLRHRITGEGIFPNRQKVEAVTNMPYPTNVKDLQRFLVMLIIWVNLFLICQLICLISESYWKKTYGIFKVSIRMR